MELHSYAKRKVPKKWTIEHKRKLVESRIRHDEIFNNKPTNSVLPWKKILSIAKLDDYNVYFVRKQWSSMVAKYKQYKQSRLGNIHTTQIDGEMIKRITHEWEFFQPIHRYMTRKTTNLHSYALTAQAEPAPQKKEMQQELLTETYIERVSNDEESYLQQHSTSSTDRVNIFSSDTNEDFAQNNIISELHIQNTDHDFYTKKSAKQLSYFADVSEESQETRLPSITIISEAALTAENVLDIKPADVQLQAQEMQPVQAQLTLEQPEQQSPLPKRGVTTNYVQQHIKEESIDISIGADAAYNNHNHTNNEQQQNQNNSSANSNLSERDKYYRHKRRFNRRLERRFDSILNVFGQIVRAEYPSIDVSPLLGSDAAASARTMMNHFFSSDSEEMDDSNEEDITTDNTLQQPKQGPL